MTLDTELVPLGTKQSLAQEPACQSSSRMLSPASKQVHDKFWIADPDGNRWEDFVVTDDSLPDNYRSLPTHHHQR